MVLMLCLAPARRLEMPVASRVEKDTLIAIDVNGRELWRKSFPYPLAETSQPRPRGRLLLGGRPRPGWPPGSSFRAPLPYRPGREFTPDLL